MGSQNLLQRGIYKLDISMRAMFWFIKSHLEAAYLLQSSKTVAFLPYIATIDDSRTVKNLIPMPNQLQRARSSQTVLEPHPEQLAELETVFSEVDGKNYWK